MFAKVFIFYAFFTIFFDTVQGAEVLEASLAQSSAASLEKRLIQIDADLGKIALPSLNSGVGPIGYRSEMYSDANHQEWVEIDLGEETLLEEVVLVPALTRDPQLGFVSDAFPAAFRILAGTKEDQVGSVVAEFHDTSDLLPRIAPVIVPLSEVYASWVRVETIRLSTRSFDGKHVFLLAEVLVFSGEENRALRRPVRASTTRGDSATWNPNCLVDGIFPYVMNSALGEQSIAFLSKPLVEDEMVITIDLEQRTEVSGIRFHPVDQSDTVPQAFSGDFGLPRRFRVEGAERSDFSDGVVLLNAQLASIFDSGPIVAWNMPETACRYLRLRFLEPNTSPEALVHRKRYGFAEIEVLSKGLNVAVGKALQSSVEAGVHNRSLDALNDGRNLYGDILPLRAWLGQLAQRHDLETERPRVAVELSHRYALNKTKLRWMIWAMVALLAGVGLLVFYYRQRAQRQEVRIRERIAANLHDELGANLHAIGLLGDLAKDAIDSPEDLIDTVDQIRSLTERTGVAARNCANMLEAEDLFDDLVGDMKRDADRLLADLEHSVLFEGEEFLERFSRRKRIDLSLFYKEALINVIRHSGATEVTTHLVATPNKLHLRVSDNGHGFTGEDPVSLKRRARLLGADLKVEHSESGGAGIVLILKIRKLKILK
ncbi:histidine kinase [Akkermansiaceae bacterium]|nr:histidine kinase [Akkermansiaceae bacterium]